MCWDCSRIPLPTFENGEDVVPSTCSCCIAAHQSKESAGQNEKTKVLCSPQVGHCILQRKTTYRQGSHKNIECKILRTTTAAS